jgi:hypothetical protein
LLEGWPTEVTTLLREESLAHAMWEMRHKLLVADVIEALHAEAIPTVVLKGTAYAYGLYDHPSQRFRGDTDLLVGEGDLQAARERMGSLGWHRLGGDPGPFGPMHYQEIWQYRDTGGLTHDIDLHWEVTNSRALRSVLDADRVLEEAVPLPRLAPHALCAEPVTALLHRAINRAVHVQSGYYSIDRNEYDPNRLAWALDLDLLVRQLSRSAWDDLICRGAATGTAPIIYDALTFARRSLASPIPDEAMGALAAAPEHTPAARFLTSSSNLERALADLESITGLRARVTYILARAFPSNALMRSKYPSHARWPLWALYLRRHVTGVAKVLGWSRA